MKKLLLGLALSVLLAGPALAAEPETLIKGDHEHGGFGGPVVRMTVLNYEPAVMVGGRGGWIIDHKFVLGGGGYGLTTNTLETEEGISEKLTFGYGGIELEYIGSSDKLVHWSLYTLLGAGSIAPMRMDDDEEMDENSFFVAEPMANLEVNIAKFFRIGLGIGYRFVVGPEAYGFEGMDLSGVSGGLTFKFGKF